MSAPTTIRGIGPPQTDEAVRDVAEAVSAGGLDEAAARRNIAVLLAHSAAVSREVAEYQARHPGASSAALDAVRTECERLLTAKVTDPGVSSHFDIDRARSTSPTGWASNLLRSARRHTTAKVHRSLRESATAVVGEPDDARWSSISRSVSDYSKAEVMLSVHDWLEARRSTPSQSAREAERAQAFMTAFDLPQPLRPGYGERRQVHRIITEYPDSCWHAAAAQFRAVGGRITGDLDESFDSRIAALWDDYSRDQLARLVLKDDRAAALLGRVYTADFIRPSSSAIKKFISAAARTTDFADDRGLLRHAAKAFIEVEFSTEPLNLSTTRSTREERQAVQDAYAAEAPRLFSEAATVRGRPLGVNADEVYDSLYRMAAPFTRERTVGAGEL